jgi:hypothetical protein
MPKESREQAKLHPYTATEGRSTGHLFCNAILNDRPLANALIDDMFSKEILRGDRPRIHDSDPNRHFQGSPNDRADSNKNPYQRGTVFFSIHNTAMTRVPVGYFTSGQLAAYNRVAKPAESNQVGPNMDEPELGKAPVPAPKQLLVQKPVGDGLRVVGNSPKPSVASPPSPEISDKSTCVLSQ